MTCFFWLHDFGYDFIIMAKMIAKLVTMLQAGANSPPSKETLKILLQDWVTFTSAAALLVASLWHETGFHVLHPLTAQGPPPPPPFPSSCDGAFFTQPPRRNIQTLDARESKSGGSSSLPTCLGIKLSSNLTALSRRNLPLGSGSCFCNDHISSHFFSQFPSFSVVGST